MKKREYKRERKGMQNMLRLMHAVDPISTSAIMEKLAAEMQKLPLTPQLGAPLRWTYEWRKALYVFVERQVEKAKWNAFIQNRWTGQRMCQLARQQALRKATEKQFPFRNATIGAAKIQHSKAKKDLAEADGHFDGLSFIHSAIVLELIYAKTRGSKQLFDSFLSESPLHPVPDWAWDMLQENGLLLRPDPQ